MNKLVIAISGLAQAGKDTFCRLLINKFEKRGIKAERFALADELKEKINPFLVQNFNINIFDCTIQQKELVRPLLVTFGKIKRIQSEGKYWTNLLQNQIMESKATVAIITDVRYDEYSEDEIFWSKNKMKAPLVYISRNGIKPPNKEEMENDPKLKAAADYIVNWYGCPAGYLLDTFLDGHINEFIAWLEKGGRLSNIGINN